LIGGEPVINCTSEAVEQSLPLGVRMLAAGGLPDTFREKSQTTSKKAKPGKESQIVKQHRRPQGGTGISPPPEN